ncbi:hypothetical protein GCM10010216_20770 [Streptomyces flaveolus]|nr:hypothetical protein GCM10010216_20770 [Streptomyces flaveolus]
MFLRLLPVLEMSGCGAAPGGELRGQDEVVAVGGDQLSGQFLRLAELVAVRAVQEGAAGLGEPVEDPACVVRLGARAPAGADVRGAERVLGHAQSGPVTEGRVTHGMSLHEG